MYKYVNIIKLYQKLKKTISVEISEWYDGRQLKVNELDDLDVIECTGSYGLEVRDGYLKGNKIRGAFSEGYGMPGMRVCRDADRAARRVLQPEHSDSPSYGNRCRFALYYPGRSSPSLMDRLPFRTGELPFLLSSDLRPLSLKHDSQHI